MRFTSFRAASISLLSLSKHEKNLLDVDPPQR